MLTKTGKTRATCYACTVQQHKKQVSIVSIVTSVLRGTIATRFAPSLVVLTISVIYGTTHRLNPYTTAVTAEYAVLAKD